MCIWCKVTQRDSVSLSSKYSNNISARINSDPTFDMNLATLGCVSRLRLWVFVSPSTPTVYVTAAARSIVVFNIPLNWVYAVSPTWYFTFRRLHSLTTIDYFRHILQTDTTDLLSYKPSYFACRLTEKVIRACKTLVLFYFSRRSWVSDGISKIIAWNSCLHLSALEGFSRCFK